MRRFVILLLCLSCFALSGQQSGPPKRETGYGVFRGRPVTFEIVNGLAICEGDIVLGTVEEIEAATIQWQLKTPAQRQLEASARLGDQYKWTGGVIPYVVDPTIPKQQRVFDAIQHWNTQTPIRMVPRTSQPNYLEFLRYKAGGVCSSNVGMIGGRQTIQTDDACGTGTMIHEIGHTVGLYHEQSRNDRDAHVRILYENIESGRASQFDQRLNTSLDIGPYDYSSIMHYPGGSFSKNLLPTIVTVPLGIPIGQRNTLSAADLDAVQRFYGNAPARTAVSTNPEGLTIIVDGASYTSPQTFDWVPGSTHVISVPASVQTGSTSRWVFGRWSDDCARTHTVIAGPQHTVFIASFVRQLRFTTRVSPVGSGAVQVTPPSEDGYYAQGAEIQVAALPSSGYCFSHWTMPAGRELHGPAANPAALTVGAYEYTANFTTTPVTLVTTSPEGLTVTVDGVPGLSPRSFLWNAGSTHTIAVAETVVPGSLTETLYRFQGWSDGGPPAHAITAAGGATTYVAQFVAQHLVAVSTTPRQGGSVSVTPSPQDGFYDEGSAVQFTATPAGGYKFARWSDGLTGSENPALLTVKGPGTVTGNFGIPGELTSANVLSAATLTRGPVSPGGIFTILGVDIGPQETAGLRLDNNGLVATELSGARVLFDGKAAPLIYVSRNQINGVAPYSIAGKLFSQLEVNVSGQKIGLATVVVEPVRPAIFTLDASGTGQGAILNQDLSVNSPSNPAARGSIIVLYATGEGRTDPPGVDGKLAAFPLPKPLLPVTVRIGGRLAEVLYAGAAPELVAGVIQVNVRVPEDTFPEDGVPVVLTVGDTSSTSRVTAAVR